MRRLPAQIAPLAVMTAIAACAATQSAAADPTEAFGIAVRRQIDGALSVLGLAAVPSETASTLVLNTRNSSGEGSDFQAGQLGGGFTVSEDLPIWLEGFIGWNRYDPRLIFSDGTEDRQVPLNWTSVAATGGLGYDFRLADHWVLRPQVNVTLGRVQTDLSVGAQVIANHFGVDTDAFVNGGVTAGGLGGSAVLEYNRRWQNDVEADLTLRHTHIWLEPIGGDKDLVGHAEAITTTLWTRLRLPTGYHAFDRPVRTVYEASGSYLSGDQGKVLDTEWLVQVGFGGEIDLAETWVPWVTTTRVVARYTLGDHLEGFSIGLAASF